MLRNDLPSLYDFYVVAKEKSLSKAAQNNFVSQSNLSRSIQNLEKTMGLILMTRNNKGIKLTLDGERLYKKLDSIFRVLEEENIFSLSSNEEIFGLITIGTTRNIADYVLEKYLTLFNKKYPQVKIKIITDSASNLNDYLINHKIDVLIDYLPHINSSEKLDIEVKAIGQFNTCFACSSKFYAKNKDKIKTLKDLMKYNLVIPGNSRRRQLLDELLQSNSIKLDPSIEMPDSKLMADFVSKNDYVGYFIDIEANDFKLVKLDLQEDLPLNYVGIIYPKHTVNKITQEFIKLVVSNDNN